MPSSWRKYSGGPGAAPPALADHTSISTVSAASIRPTHIMLIREASWEERARNIRYRDPKDRITEGRIWPTTDRSRKPRH